MSQSFALALTVVYWVVSTWYLRGKRHVRPGMPRLIVGSPLLLASLTLPLFYDYRDDPITVMTVFSMLCLSCFKVLAWCLNRGPLCLKLTFWQELAILNFPIMPAEVCKGVSALPTSHADDAVQLLTRCLIKTVLLGVLNKLLVAEVLPSLLQAYTEGLSMCFFLGGVQDLMAFLATNTLGLELAPLFDQPWLSKSLAEWWSHRWNVPGSLIFRALVYDPLLEGRWVRPDNAPLVQQPKGGSLQRAAAMTASFALSGVGHELMYWYAMRHFSGWWFAFFVVQALLVAVERAARKALLRTGVKIPPWVDALRVNLLVTITANLFMLAPAAQAGLTDRINASIQSSFSTVVYAVTGHPAAAPVAAVA